MAHALSPQDKIVLGQLLDPSTPEETLLWLMRSHSFRSTRQLIYTPEPEREVLRREIAEAAPYLEPEVIEKFFSTLDPWQGMFLNKFGLLNPALSCGALGKHWKELYLDAFDAERYFAWNQAASFSMEQANDWPEDAWRGVINLLDVRFAKSFDGCDRWAYIKGIAESWSTSGELLLQEVGKKLLPAAQATPCRETMTREEMEATLLLWSEATRFTGSTKEALERAGVDNYGRAWASSFFLHLSSDHRSDAARNGITTRLVTYLRHEGYKNVAIAAFILRDFRAAERVAGLSGTWHGMQHLLEDV